MGTSAWLRSHRIKLELEAIGGYLKTEWYIKLHSHILGGIVVQWMVPDSEEALSVVLVE